MQLVLLGWYNLVALGYAKDNKVLPLAVSEHVLCLWRTLHAVLPAVVVLAVGLGPGCYL